MLLDKKSSTIEGMSTLTHNIIVQHLVGSRTAKEGVPLANQFILFSFLWLLITTGISYLGWNNFSADKPVSWLMILFPLMGVYLLITGLQCKYYWKGMGKASLFLAKASFHCNDTIRGYTEFKDLKWHGSCKATAHISLKKKQATGDYKEEWITKAATQMAPGNRGLRVSFSSIVRPSLDEQPTPERYTWCLHISLEHNGQRYKEEFKIPMSENE